MSMMSVAGEAWSSHLDGRTTLLARVTSGELCTPRPPRSHAGNTPPAGSARRVPGSDYRQSSSTSAVSSSALIRSNTWYPRPAKSARNFWSGISSCRPHSDVAGAPRPPASRTVTRDAAVTASAAAAAPRCSTGSRVVALCPAPWKLCPVGTIHARWCPFVTVASTATLSACEGGLKAWCGKTQLR